MTELEIAEQIAREAHANMMRKFKNVMYIEHPKAVVDMLIYPDEKIVGWLHDVLEDNPYWSPERLIQKGISRDNVAAVIALTRKPMETYYDFILRVLANPLARRVKIADIKDNLIDLPPSHQNLRDKYLLAQHLLLVGVKYPHTDI